MRGMILLGVILVLAGGMATPARGQAGQINVFVDSLYTRCWLDESYVEWLTLYVVHQGTPGATGCRFMLQVPSHSCWIYRGESSAYTAVGDTRTGVTVDYGACLASSVLVMKVYYYIQLACSGWCTVVQAIPDPAAPSGTIEVYDCNGNVLVGNGQPLFINPYFGNCPVWCNILPVDEATWGRVKALYE
jgi:hypothetical protein